MKKYLAYFMLFFSCFISEIHAEGGGGGAGGIYWVNLPEDFFYAFFEKTYRYSNKSDKLSPTLLCQDLNYQGCFKLLETVEPDLWDVYFKALARKQELLKDNCFKKSVIAKPPIICDFNQWQENTALAVFFN